MNVSASAGPRPATTRPRAVLAVLCLTQLLLTLDDNVVNIALPSIQRDLGLAGSSQIWVINAYMLTFGGLLVLGGRLGDRYTLVRTFSVGTAVFAVASLACGLAQEPWQLIAARAVQGVGAALVAPAVLGLMTVVFTRPEDRARAFALWGATTVAGALSGLILSGLITGYASWRWIFFINLPVTALALLALPRLTRGMSMERGTQPLNWRGAGLLTVSLSLAAFALLSVGGGERLPWTAVTAVVSLLLLGAFVGDQRRSAHPLVARGVFATPTRARALMTAVLLSAAMFQGFLVLTLYLQNGLGYDPLAAGLAYLPFAMASLSGIKAAERATVRFGAGRVLTVACVSTALGALLLAWASAAELEYSWLLPGILLFAGGIGAGLPSSTTAATQGADEQTSGVIAALVNSSQQLGGALGLAVVGVALGAAGRGFGSALATAAALSVLACVTSVFVVRAEQADGVAGPERSAVG